MPGSGIHGRKTRRWPAANAFLARATARRVVRSEPPKPSARSLSWTTSARTLPWLRSTHSSTLPRCGSMSWLRRTGSSSGRPRARSRTYRATVLGEQPTSSAASRRLPVRSNASRISTASPADFTSPSWLLGLSNLSEPGGSLPDLPIWHRSSQRVQFSWPPVGSFGGRQRSAFWPPAFRFPWPLPPTGRADQLAH